jgi:hypothetical protein
MFILDKLKYINVEIYKCLIHTGFGIIFGPDNLQSNLQNADKFRERARTRDVAE